MTMGVITSGLLLILSAVLSNGLYNAALYKPAIQSSLWQSHTAEHGVDGKYNVDNFDDFCQHTQNDSIPWWMVDLRGLFVIEKITLINRANDSFHNELRLKNFTIDIFDHDPRELGNFPNVSGDVCYYQGSSLPGGMYNFTCPKPILGRYVRLIIRDEYGTFLHFCEMEVLVSSSMVEESYFDRQVNTKLSGTPYVTLANTDSSNCLLECLLRRSTSHCAAFNWDTIKRSCELFIVDPYDDLTSNLTAVSGTNFYLQRNVLV